MRQNKNTQLSPKSRCNQEIADLTLGIMAAAQDLERQYGKDTGLNFEEIIWLISRAMLDSVTPENESIDVCWG